MRTCTTTRWRRSRATRGSTKPTRATANASQDVDVAARDEVTETIVAGALGLGGGALGAGIDVNLLNNNVQAYIGGSNVTAKDTVEVNAHSDRALTIDAIAAAAGGARHWAAASRCCRSASGLAPGYSTTDDNNKSTSDNALAPNNSNASVMSSLNGAIGASGGAVDRTACHHAAGRRARPTPRALRPRRRRLRRLPRRWPRRPGSFRAWREERPPRSTRAAPSPRPMSASARPNR